MHIKRITKRNIDPNPDKILTLQELSERKNKILIYRKWGGLGDIVNQLPLFKTIKNLYPEMHITYAIPIQFHPIAELNSYIDEIIDCKKVDLSQYGYIVDISTDCGKYENSHLPLVDKHRSDIWAEMSLGISLSDHDFCIDLNNDFQLKMKDKLENYYGYKSSPKIFICPKSASTSKDLLIKTLLDFIDIMLDNGYNPCIIDRGLKIPGIKIPLICDLTLKEFIYTVSLFDYIISVDTGSFHLGAALKIPTLGIFPWTDGKILSKYHPKVEILQKQHRDYSEFKECPCWDWPMCKYKTKGKQIIPLKCMSNIEPVDIYDKFINLIGKYPYKKEEKYEN